MDIATNTSIRQMLQTKLMSIVDVRTILLTSSLMPGLMSLVMFSLGRNFPRNIRGVANWAQGALLESVAVTLLSFRGSIPDWLSVILGNFCLIGGIGLWLIGSQRFFEREPSRYLVAFLVLIDVLGLTVMTWIAPTAAGRALCSNLILAFLYGRQAHVMLRYGRSDGRSLFVGAMFLLQSIVTSMRVLTSFASTSSSGGLLARDLAQVIYLGCGLFMGLTVTVAFMLVAMNRLRMQLEQQSLIDPLTGLLNRRAFVQAHANEQQAAVRHGGKLSLLLMDIDHFKRVNDTYGHLKGDEILVDFSKRTATFLPPTAHLARWGGEEFVALVPRLALHETMTLANSVRQQIASDPSASLLQYTCSIGVASIEGKEATLERLVRSADEALYRAKRSGRNRVAASEAEVGVFH
jgi:diguanylate cyclase (GGDEF)-like protein